MRSNNNTNGGGSVLDKSKPTHHTYNVSYYKNEIHTSVAHTKSVRPIRHHNSGTRNKVVVLQLCVSDRCLIFQFDFLGNGKYIFVGIGIDADAHKFMVDHDLKVAKIKELKTIRTRCTIDSQKYLARDVLQQILPKRRYVQLSKWECGLLSDEQVEYACLDAVVSFKLGVELMSRANPVHTYQNNNNSRQPKKVEEEKTKQQVPHKSNGGKTNRTTGDVLIEYILRN
ncbi:hypothetical protein MKX01_003934 [Papaver californicum]|nr:hypothetical protein MKX01_003934 [Papaver californicum]